MSVWSKASFTGKFHDAQFSGHPEVQGPADDITDLRRWNDEARRAELELDSVDMTNVENQTIRDFIEEAYADKGKKGKKGKGKGKGKQERSENRSYGRPLLVKFSKALTNGSRHNPLTNCDSWRDEQGYMKLLPLLASGSVWRFLQRDCVRNYDLVGMLSKVLYAPVEPRGEIT